MIPRPASAIHHIRAAAELLRAQWALLVAVVRVWRRPTGELVSQVSLPGAAVRRPPNPEAVRIARAVRRAASYGVFRPRCLVRSLAIQSLLERRGIAGSVVRIGTQRTGGRFAAHAWVELDGRVLGDDPAIVASYRQLADLNEASR